MKNNIEIYLNYDSQFIGSIIKMNTICSCLLAKNNNALKNGNLNN